MINSQTVVQGQNIVAEQNNWIDQELHESVFQDTRLLRRLRLLLGQLAQAPGQSIALVCQDWANTKAAYRFLSNAQVNEADILTGHFDATGERIAATHEAPVLRLHDTNEFSWQRESAQAVRVLGKAHSCRDAEGRVRQHTVCGLLMYSGLAVTRKAFGPACWRWHAHGRNLHATSSLSGDYTNSKCVTVRAIAAARCWN